MKITIPLPPSLNSTYKTGNGRFYKSQEAKEWEKEAGYIYLSSKRQKLPDGSLYVGIEYFLKRNRDIDNGLKITLDFLQKQGIIKNDIAITHLNVKKYIDKENPRCEIQIERLAI